MKKKPIILIIRDGWGYRASRKQNAIAQGKTPNTDRLMRQYPNILIEASGEAVGLPKGYQGNSEVGHLTIGSGRIIFQSLERINKSIRDKDFFKNKTFLRAIKNCKKNKSKLHLIGLLQVEGVHAHIDHLFALLDLCKKEKFKDIYVHVITDGRDSPVTASIPKIKRLQNKLKKIGFGKIVTLSGRYYAMDRDKRWNRTKKAYDCIVKGKADEFNNIIRQVKECHKKNETDEFIIPRKLKDYEGIKKKDSIIFYNFRTDRPRQLTQAIVEKKILGWKRKPLDVYFAAMTQYYIPMNANVAFKDIILKNLLGEVISKKGLKQLRISETEKYAHVTFFFNGQIEKPYKNEERILIHSPKVATYDLKPEMSAYEITKSLLKEIDKDRFDLIVVNLVNGDMVGHTGVIKACLKAVNVVDDCVGKITNKILEKDGTALVFADHGNIEDQTPMWRTSHTRNKVPFILVSSKGKKVKLRNKGGLSDIAPTVLDLFGIKKPKEMSGKSLVKK
ncbi:2,3-bisphosphoglycerate-independent phosphoglycerate mutase [Candidatus Woesearchaeota archaeon]|nr:2,3-bisphosphoglycerate-independent phosphoglycerate mutase [Candidatus Woesearchaeota archaeon]